MEGWRGVNVLWRDGGELMCYGGMEGSYMFHFK